MGSLVHPYNRVKEVNAKTQVFFYLRLFICRELSKSETKCGAKVEEILWVVMAQWLVAFSMEHPALNQLLVTKKVGQRAHNVIPVNISDILNAPDEKLKIEDTEVHMVTFVGTVENIESKQTNISYSVRDDTGTIEVVQWIEG